MRWKFLKLMDAHTLSSSSRMRTAVERQKKPLAWNNTNEMVQLLCIGLDLDTVDENIEKKKIFLSQFRLFGSAAFFFRYRFAAALLDSAHDRLRNAAC